MRLNKTNFVELAKNIHGDTYSYEKVTYIRNSVPVIIVCSKHGEFGQRPVDHIHQKSGCPKCAIQKVAESNKISKKSFIERASKIHGNFYDYHRVSYSFIKDKVTITCPEHGDFRQSAQSHLAGHGCSKCAGRGFDKFKPGILYIIKIEYNSSVYYKVGVTNRNVDERFSSETKVKITTVHEEKFTLGFDAYIMEQIIIRNNLNNLYKGKPFMKTNKNTELFTEKLSMPKNEYGKLTKPADFVGPEVKLQEILNELT